MARTLAASRPMDSAPAGKAKLESFKGPAKATNLGFTPAPRKERALRVYSQVYWLGKNLFSWPAISYAAQVQPQPVPACREHVRNRSDSFLNTLAHGLHAYPNSYALSFWIVPTRVAEGATSPRLLISP